MLIIIEQIKSSNSKLIRSWSLKIYIILKNGNDYCLYLLQIKPISISYGLGVPDHDSEGRLVTVEFDNFYLLCSYVPNSGDGLRRLVYYSLPIIE